MPTFNQLVRQGRSDKVYKSKAPVLQKGFTSCSWQFMKSFMWKMCQQASLFPKLSGSPKSTMATIPALLSTAFWVHLPAA